MDLSIPGFRWPDTLKAPSIISRARSSLRRRPTATISLFSLLALVVLAVGAPIFATHDPQVPVLAERLKPPSLGVENGGVHIFGTDHLGRDVWSRVVFGTRVSLFVGLTTAVLSGLIGISIGLTAGYYKAPMGHLLDAVIDLQQAFPFFAFAILVIATIGGGLWNVVLVLAVTSWVPLARVVRAETLQLKESAFVEAARATGVGPTRIMLVHILRNVMSSVLVVSTFVFSQAILSEASLTFLGLGVPPSIPTWGGILSSSRDYIRVGWWLVMLPGMVLMAAVLSTNTVGDWLRDVLDPRSRQSDQL